MAASWGLVSVVNKRLLEDVHLVPLNFLVRIVAIDAPLAMTVPLTVFRVWPYGFGINAPAFWCIVAAACVTWLVAFTAYYYALRAGRVNAVAPVSSTDPLWTAVFALLLMGAALRASTLLGMAVAICGVVLISRWMDDGAATTAGPADGAVVPPLPEAKAAAPTGDAAAQAGAASGRSLTFQVVALSLLAAAGWGLGRVLVEMAENAYGAPRAAVHAAPRPARRDARHLATAGVRRARSPLRRALLPRDRPDRRRAGRAALGHGAGVRHPRRHAAAQGAPQRQACRGRGSHPGRGVRRHRGAPVHVAKAAGEPFGRPPLSSTLCGGPEAAAFTSSCRTACGGRPPS